MMNRTQMGRWLCSAARARAIERERERVRHHHMWMSTYPSTNRIRNSKWDSHARVRFPVNNHLIIVTLRAQIRCVVMHNQETNAHTTSDCNQQVWWFSLCSVTSTEPKWSTSKHKANNTHTPITQQQNSTQTYKARTINNNSTRNARVRFASIITRTTQTTTNQKRHKKKTNNIQDRRQPREVK